MSVSASAKSWKEVASESFTKINEGLTQQLERDSMIDIPSFRPLLPDMDLKITAGKDNPIYNILQQYYITFDNLNIEASTSPEEGFFLDADLFNLMQDTTRIVSISAFPVRTIPKSPAWKETRVVSLSL